MTTVTTMWDVIETPSGAVIIVVPPSPLPTGIRTDGDIIIETAAKPVRLDGSSRLVALIREAPHIVVAEADEAPRRETVVAFMENDNG